MVENGFIIRLPPALRCQIIHLRKLSEIEWSFGCDVKTNSSSSAIARGVSKLDGTKIHNLARLLFKTTANGKRSSLSWSQTLHCFPWHLSCRWVDTFYLSNFISLYTCLPLWLVVHHIPLEKHAAASAVAFNLSNSSKLTSSVLVPGGALPQSGWLIDETRQTISTNESASSRDGSHVSIWENFISIRKKRGKQNKWFPCMTNIGESIFRFFTFSLSTYVLSYRSNQDLMKTLG